MIKLKKNKNINIEKNKNSSKKKYFKKFKNIGKIIGLSSVFILAADYSISNYLDNKVNSIVSKEQIEEFNNITDYKNREKFLNERLNYTYYSDEKYKSDLKIIENFNEELKKEIKILYQQSNYIKNNFPEYENFDNFLKEYLEYDYAYYIKSYYLYQKDMGKEINYDYKMSKNNNIYYIYSFFFRKILDDKLSKNERDIDYEKLDKDIFNLKKISWEEKIELYSKDVLFNIRNGEKSLLERLIIQNELPSYQLTVIYNKKINDERIRHKYETGEEDFFDKNVKEKLNYNNKSTIMKEVIDKSIDNFFQNKSIIFKDINIRNTLMILNAQSEYENNMLKIVEIKNENKKKITNINYSFYNYLNDFNLTLNNLVRTKENFEPFENERNIKSFIAYKNLNQKINYFLSGIDDNNNDTEFKGEDLILEKKESDYNYK